MNPSNNTQKSLPLQLEEDLYTELQALADANDLPIEEVVRIAVMRHMSQEADGKPVDLSDPPQASSFQPAWSESLPLLKRPKPLTPSRS